MSSQRCANITDNKCAITHLKIFLITVTVKQKKASVSRQILLKYPYIKLLTFKKDNNSEQNKGANPIRWALNRT